MNGLSIVVPAHDAGNAILDALSSIKRALSYLRDRNPGYRLLACDVIVVDDGSRDDSHRVVSEFARGKDHYTIVRREGSTSAGCARNKGASTAR